MNNVEKLMQDPKVIQATAFLKGDTENVLKEQLEIVQIPAPSNDEGERTEDFARRLNEMGYEPVTDGAGNVTEITAEYDPASRGDIRAAADAFKAETVDYTRESIVLRVTADSVRIDSFLDLMRDYDILEICRTGVVSLERGAETIRSGMQV